MDVRWRRCPPVVGDGRDRGASMSAQLDLLDGGIARLTVTVNISRDLMLKTMSPNGVKEMVCKEMTAQAVRALNDFYDAIDRERDDWQTEFAKTISRTVADWNRTEAQRQKQQLKETPTNGE